MQIKNHLYAFRYHETESALCNLEAKYIFKNQDENKLLFSDRKIDPSNSAFIKNRLDIISSSTDYDQLIKDIKKKEIQYEGFKVEYIIFEGDKTRYADRLTKLKDIGYSIDGIPDYYTPTITYALCNYFGTWCFGILIKNNFDWLKHKKKPYSYSNSISIDIAKALVNIAAETNKEKTLLDACCGVGTIVLEACFAGYNIEGCEINWKVCNNAKKNIAHFNYKTKIEHCDIKEIRKWYDAAIIDLPYNLSSYASNLDIQHIVESTALITNRMVIVSISDISNLISRVGFKIVDHCTIRKKGKTAFARKIWVCQKSEI